jgi:hypothetical protein
MARGKNPAATASRLWRVASPMLAAWAATACHHPNPSVAPSRSDTVQRDGLAVQLQSGVQHAVGDLAPRIPAADYAAWAVPVRLDLGYAVGPLVAAAHGGIVVPATSNHTGLPTLLREFLGLGLELHTRRSEQFDPWVRVSAEYHQLRFPDSRGELFLPNSQPDRRPRGTVAGPVLGGAFGLDLAIDRSTWAGPLIECQAGRWSTNLGPATHGSIGIGARIRFQ